MTEVSDPGNVSALSSEVGRLIEEELRAQHIQGFLPTEDDEQEMRLRLRDLVRKALATVEAERDGWKEQSASFCNAEVAALTTLQAAREQARALAEALRGVLDSAWPNPADHPAMFKAFVTARAALASWDTSQKESR